MIATCSTPRSTRSCISIAASWTLYKGTYSSFEEQRTTREMLDAKHARRQADERKRLQAFVDRFKAKASKARQAQSRVKMLERMKPVTALVTQDVREISFPVPEKTLSPRSSRSTMSRSATIRRNRCSIA